MVKRHRSPSYPSLTLTESVNRARTFYQIEGKHAAPVSAAVSHWGYSAKSSGGGKAVSSLKAYGLMVDSGAVKNRVVSLTDEGLAIVRDGREISPERDALLKQAAMKPKVIAILNNEYPDHIPSSETLNYFLVSHEYNPNAVSDIIKVYTDAMNYINLSSETQEEDSDTNIDEYSEPDDDKGNIPKSYTLHTEPNLVTPSHKSTGLRQERFSLEAGEIIIQFPSSMTKEDYEDFTDWLQILQRKIKRTVTEEDL